MIAFCESCRAVPFEIEVSDGPEELPYRVCRACEQRLRAYALRPLEWFNLAAKRGPSRFALHNDFYGCGEDDYGVAYQSQEEVEEPERFPVPTLSEIQGNLERLIDYAMTIYFLDEPHGVRVVNMLSALGPTLDEQIDHKQLLLSSLQRRVAQSVNASGIPNLWIESSAHILCARCLGPLAANWIREQWNAQPFRSAPFPSLSDATAACLPFEEGWKCVTDRLEIQSDSDAISALIPFHSTRTLDWMEEHRIGAATDAWGRVAALSHFTWSRAQAWLDSGRPLSHVALAAIQACQHYDTIVTRQLKPVLEEPASIEEMSTALNAYAAHDNVPNVRRRVASILPNLEQNS